MNEKLPVLFIGHGSPMNVVEDTSFTRFLRDLGPRLPLPRAILSVSAHWETGAPRVLSAPAPETIHDFGGFPRALFEVQYRAPGAPELAARVSALTGAAPGNDWGFDHGTWSVLHHLYPAAAIPVIQLSLGRSLNFRAHYELGQKLKPLSEEGVLILASGNITHNLRELRAAEDAPADAWAEEFDTRIARALEGNDLPTLLAEPAPDALWRRAHPRPDHYLPLLYALGAGEGRALSYPFTGFQHGTLSMRAVRFG